jgi:beta-galactosidase
MTTLQITADGFRLGAQPFRILSGGLHYFRIHPEQWADRLRKARLLGLNTVETYVPWNLHQPRPGTWRSEGILDLTRFLDLAAAEGLSVLLRPGPYICAEWEGGGLPSWLLATEPGIRLRSTDPRFLAAVDDYLDRLLPPLLPYLASRGGPVLAVQVDNEYGAYASAPAFDPDYLAAIAERLRARGVDVPLLTADQVPHLADGGLAGALRTVNPGGRVAEGIAELRRQQPEGPLMVGELWIGWFDHWGGPHAERPVEDAAAALDTALAAGASVNIYMLHGGTNFGLTNGANDDRAGYRPTVTSYDYGAPLDEAGDATPLYHAFREVIGKYAELPADPAPAPGPKLALPGVRLTERAALPLPAPPPEAVRTRHPVPMEKLGQDFGLVHYAAELPAAGPALLHAPGVRDRAVVLVDGAPAGVLSRGDLEFALALLSPRAGARLELWVENQGRVNYGPGLADRKGLLGPVTVNGAELHGWTSTPLPPDALGPAVPDEAFVAVTGEPGAPPLGPVLYRTDFRPPDGRTADSHLSLDGWTKGLVWINGFLLGRYWSRGPQRTLHVPAPVLRPDRNRLLILELQAVADPVVDFRPTPDLGSNAG